MDPRDPGPAQSTTTCFCLWPGRGRPNNSRYGQRKSPQGGSEENCGRGSGTTTFGDTLGLSLYTQRESMLGWFIVYSIDVLLCLNFFISQPEPNATNTTRPIRINPKSYSVSEESAWSNRWVRNQIRFSSNQFSI